MDTNSHKEINEELKELQASFTGGIEGRIHSVPDQYFAQFAAELPEAIQSNRITQSLPKDLPFLIPENYFESLPKLVLENLTEELSASEEIELLSPLLAGLKDKTTFGLPDQNYFNQLLSNSPKSGNTISFASVSQPVFRRVKWMRWVAAAAVLCIFSIGGINYLGGTNSSGASDLSIQAALANISDAAIQQYLSNNMDAYDLYSTVSDKSINSKISPNEEKMLNHLSDEEIENILENQIN